MSYLGMSRYGVDPAPGKFGVVQELLNTGSSGDGELPDLLQDSQLAIEWIAEVRKISGADKSFDGLEMLSEADLYKMRFLREAVTAAVSGSHPKITRAGIMLTLDSEGRVDAVKSDKPLPWLYSTVLLESLFAQHSGDWRRLKICANPDCDVSFYDRSKNRSGVWHNVHVCGNAIKLRASRSRRREMTSTSI